MVLLINNYNTISAPLLRDPGIIRGRLKRALLQDNPGLAQLPRSGPLRRILPYLNGHMDWSTEDGVIMISH